MPTEYVGKELDLFREAHRWKTYLQSRMAPFIRGDVLEVGAGIGTTTRMMRDTPHTSWTCLEPDPGHVRRLQEELAQVTDPAANIVPGKLAALTDGRKFDTILYVDVLEHIEDDRGELERAARHLAPGGAIVLLCPAHPWLFSPFDEAVGHFRRYTRNSLAELAPASLRTERSEYLDSVGLLASAANRLVLRRSQPSAAQIRLWDRRLIPLSRFTDRLLFFRLGKSVLAVLREQPVAPRRFSIGNA